MWNGEIALSYGGFVRTTHNKYNLILLRFHNFLTSTSCFLVLLAPELSRTWHCWLPPLSIIPVWQRQILYINTYMWNLKKKKKGWYRWPYFQSRNRHRHREHMYGCQRGREDGMNWEIGKETHALLTLHIKQKSDQSLLGSTGISAQRPVVT